ncbi:MAG TPA: WecB/TagA/CpsF family glycosyltransferase [Micromonosporaceae bacterium]|jgi:N-acetylglucosaminyldiphosphoundecaprenol N-acetyl-beta-D-mannosaminyltransferase
MSDGGSYRCCGVRIDGVGPEKAVRALLESRHGLPRGAHLCNSYTLALALRDPVYCAELNAGHLNFADGHYVAMVGRWRGQKDLTRRVYGPDLMLATIDRGREHALRHYLYGATPETVARLAESLRARYPGVEIVGVEAPPFRELEPTEEADLVRRVDDARPDILWVGIGTPRQDRFVARYVPALACTVVPVGAAFDFHSGTKRTAPRLVQRLGFEWLFRLAQEPRRLWRRYLVGIPTFLFGVLTDLRRPVPPRPAVPAMPAAAVPATSPGPGLPTQAMPSANGYGATAPRPRGVADVEPRRLGNGTDDQPPTVAPVSDKP